MAVDILRPDEDVVNAWTKSAGTTSFGALDDAVTAPTNARTSGDGVHLTSSTAAQESEVGFGTFTLSTDVVSQVRLKVFAAGGNRRGAAIRLLTGTTELATGSLPATTPATAEAWITVTYTGTLTQAQIDALRAEFVCTTISGGSPTAATLYAAYIEVDHAAVVTRSVALSGTGTIATSGVKVVSRSTSVTGTGTVAVAGQRDLVRSVAVAGTGTISTAGQRALQRSASVSGAGSVTVSGVVVAVHERSASVTATGTITVAGAVSAVFERSASLSGTGAITTAGYRVIGRSVAVQGTGSIATSPQRALHRQVSVTAVGSIEVSGEVGVGAAIHERSVSLAAVGSISTGRLREAVGAATGGTARNATGSVADATAGTRPVHVGRIEPSRPGRTL